MNMGVCGMQSPRWRPRKRANLTLVRSLSKEININVSLRVLEVCEYIN